MADSTFYSCCICDLYRKDWLVDILGLYEFCLGLNICREIGHILADPEISAAVQIDDSVNYSTLVLPLLARSPSHSTDGEYEAIGMAFQRYGTQELRYLILDDRRARSFTKTHFPELEPYLTGTIGFIDASSRGDRRLDFARGIEILEAICSAHSANTGSRKRICSIDEGLCTQILIPLLREMKEEYAQRRV